MATERKLEHSLPWKEWKRSWDRAKYSQELVGLLHCIFSTHASLEERDERIRLLIQVADQWSESVRYSDSIRDKAQKVLADGFFKEAHGYTISWLSRDTTLSLLSFMGYGKNGSLSNIDVRDHEPTHHKKVTWKFCTDFVESAWRSGELRLYAKAGDRHDRKDEPVQVITRAQLIPLLYHMGLVSRVAKGSEWWVRFTDDVLTALEKEILSWRYKSLEEAFLDGYEPNTGSAQICYLALHARKLAEVRKEKRERIKGEITRLQGELK